MLSTFSFHFLRIFQMTKLELFPPLVDRCLQEPCGRSRPLFALMNPCCAKCVNQLHDFCVSLSCTCCGNALETSHMTSRVCVCQDEFLSHISSCALSLDTRISKHKQKCHNKTGSFEWHPSIHAKTTGETVRRSLSSHAPARPQTARFKTCAARWNTKKRKGLSKQAALQAPASMEVAVRTVFLSVAKPGAHSCLHCPSAILQSQGFWQHKGLGKNINTYYDFGCKCHPHLQRIGNTELRKGSPPVGGRYQFHGACTLDLVRHFSFLIASQHKKILQGSGGKHSMNMTPLSSPQTALLRMLSNHTRNTPTNHELTAHVADKETLLINCHDTFKWKKRRNHEAKRTFFKSSMFRMSWLLMDMPPVFELFLSRLALHCPFVLLLDLKRVPSKVETTSSVLRQWAIKTQPLSKCVLLAMCLPKNKAKETWALPIKNLAKAFDDYLAKEGCLEDPFSKQILRNYQPCVSTPDNSWTIRRMCQSTKHCLSQMLPIIFILLLRRNIPWTTMISIVLRFGKRALERNASIFILWTWGRMLLKGIFLSNFWSLYML